MLLDLTKNQAQILADILAWASTDDPDEQIKLADVFLDEEETIIEMNQRVHKDDHCLYLTAREQSILHLVLNKELTRNPDHAETLWEVINDEDPNGEVRRKLHWLTNPKRRLL